MAPKNWMDSTLRAVYEAHAEAIESLASEGRRTMPYSLKALHGDLAAAGVVMDARSVRARWYGLIGLHVVAEAPRTASNKPVEGSIILPMIIELMKEKDNIE